MHQFDFKNKTAVITGGARGFGLDIAKKFLSSGAKVFIWDIDENELIKATKEINNSNLEPKFKEERIVNSVKKRLADISKTKTLLNFSPKIGLVEGLKNLSAWYKEK